MGFQLSAEEISGGAEVPNAPMSAERNNDPIAAEDRQRMGQWLSQFLRGELAH